MFPFQGFTSQGLTFCCQSTWELLAIALRVPDSFLKARFAQTSLVALWTDIEVWFNLAQSMKSSNTSAFFMGLNIIILGLYDNKENNHYKYLRPSLYLSMLYGTTLVAPAVVF